VKVGLPASKKHKQKSHKRGKGSEPTPIAMIGAVHEFGSEKMGIPERPWLRPGIRSGKEAFRALNRVNIVRVLRGELTAQQALGQLGAMAVGVVQRYIRSARFTPLKPATIRAKGSSAPLIDTGQMMQSVTFELSTKQEREHD